MYLLPCPKCDASIPVAPSHAGDETACPSCQSGVQIPKLGDLRQLPLAEDSESTKKEKTPSSGGGSVAFGIFGLIGVACLLVAGFCGVRWYLLPVPTSTEEHIALISETFAKASPAELIRDFEQLEEGDLDLALPFKYHTDKLYRDDWGRNASIAGVAGIFSILIAFCASSMKSKNRV